MIVHDKTMHVSATTRRRFATALLIAALGWMPASVAIGQNGRPPSRTKLQNQAHDLGTKAPPPAESLSEASDPLSELGGKLSNVIDGAANSNTDDHVRCFFTVQQLKDLLPTDGVARVTEADQSRLLMSLVETADQASETQLSREEKAQFIAILAGDLDGKLVGKTPGEALATVMNILYHIKTQSDVVRASATDASSLLDALTMYGLSNSDKARLQNDPSWFVRNNPRASSRGLADRLKNSDPGVAYVASLASIDPTSAQTMNSSLMASARTAINAMAAPKDIGCAYQILSWNQARLLFGRSVADDFIAVQITVRNLNSRQEFIVHNSELKVDADIHGGMGRYFEGVDKLAVESYNSAGEPLTPRGIVGNSIAAVSTMLSVLQPIVNAGNFSSAVASFTGGVVPGWSKMSPDHQKDQLLFIANNGFSATYSTRTVVGKSSAATFYTWFPVKPFLQGWWVQDCAQSIAGVMTSVSDPEQPSVCSNGHPDLSDSLQDTHSCASPGPSELGVDLVRARYACRNSSSSDWDAIPYKKWSSISDDLFRELSWAVVAGIHVQESNKAKGSVSSLSCPVTRSGDVDLAQASADGNITCDITGESLNKIVKLHLQNAANAVDPFRPAADVVVSGDDSNAKASFKASDLGKAPASTYAVFSVGKDGTESSTGQVIHLDPNQVVFSSVKPSAIDLAGPPDSLSLAGFHLDKLTTACVAQPGSVATGQSVSVHSTNASGISLDPHTLKLAKGSWVILPGGCMQNPDSGGVSVTVSGVNPPTIETVTPMTAAVGATITITGANLTGAKVTIGGATATSQVISDEKITAEVPVNAKSGTVEIITTSPVTVKKEGFKVVPVPKKGQR